MFNAGFETGGIYPAYSSLRKDPEGVSVLFESIRRIAPATERSYRPLASAQGSGRTLLLLGAAPDQLLESATLDHRMVETLVRQGNRVVLALKPERLASKQAMEGIQKAWGVKIQNAGTEDESDIQFSVNPDWTVVQGDRERADIVERSFGTGSLVLVASSTAFTNGAMAESPDIGLLVSILGASEPIVFDEEHLGIVEAGSVMKLMGALHLQGVLFGLLIPVGLFVWRVSASFPPAARSEPTQHMKGRHSFSGLIALLRRNLASADLAAACWQEWLKGAPRAPTPERRAQVERELIARGAQPMYALRNIHEILNRKRTD